MWMHIVFTVPDVPAVFKLLQNRGADVHTRDNSPATSYFLLHDSEGNEIEMTAQTPDK
jgi:predicted enzyme related to lactoylglutathione lyase